MRLRRSASRPDIRHELPGGGPVDVVGLQNGIRQQPDGRQRRFQLMGGIGHKPPPGILRGLEPVCQAVELLAQIWAISSWPPISVRWL